MEFLKRFWAQILLALAAALTLVLGRRGQPSVPTPPCPQLPDVKIPDVNTSPADDYVAGRTPVTTETPSVVDELNARHR